MIKLTKNFPFKVKKIIAFPVFAFAVTWLWFKSNHEQLDNLLAELADLAESIKI